MESALLRLLALDRLSKGLDAGDLSRLIDENAPLMQKLMALEPGGGASSGAERGRAVDASSNERAPIVDYYNASAYWLTQFNSGSQPVDLSSASEANQLHIGRHRITRPRRAGDSGSGRPEIGQCFVSVVDVDGPFFQERFLIKKSERASWLTGESLEFTLTTDQQYLPEESSKRSAVAFIEQRQAMAAAQEDALTMAVTYRYCIALKPDDLALWKAKAVSLKPTDQPDRALFEVSTHNGGHGWLLREFPEGIPEYEVVDHWQLNTTFKPSAPQNKLALMKRTPSQGQSTLDLFLENASAITQGWYVRVAYRMDQI